jgi:hypothetical protein
VQQAEPTTRELLERAAKAAEARPVEPHRHGVTCTTACPSYQPLDQWFHAGDFCPRKMPGACEGHALESPEQLRERSAAARAGRHVADE